MNTFDVRPLPSIATVVDMRSRYLDQATAPLDGMWLYGFVPMSKHYGFYDRNSLCGYFCLNEQGRLLQFYVDDRHCMDALSYFQLVVTGDVIDETVVGAFVSTAEPAYLSLCLDTFASFDVNALMYELDVSKSREKMDSAVVLEEAVAGQLSQVVDFAASAIGAPKDWLAGYYENLINRGELYVVRRDGEIIATGESRLSDAYESGYADVGVIVAKNERGQGIATQVLRRLVEINESRDRQSICSTEKGNRAAQRAISRAGFVSRHRIVEFSSPRSAPVSHPMSERL